MEEIDAELFLQHNQKIQCGWTSLVDFSITP
jgi:hypothetical protein